MKRFLIISFGIIFLVSALVAAYFLYGNNIYRYFNPTKDILSIGFDSLPASLSPFSLDPSQRALKWNVYQALFDMDPYLRPEKNLVLSYIKSDEKTWKFTLKKGVRFQDNSEMKSSDVKYSLDYALKEGSFELKLYISTIDSIKVIDDSSFEIVTKELDPQLPLKLAQVPIVRPHGDELWGTGPYYLKSKTDEAMIFERSDSYNGSLPDIKTVELLAIADKTLRVENLQKKRIELLASVPTGREHLSSFLNNPDYLLKDASSLSSLFLVLSPSGKFAGQKNDLVDEKIRSIVYRALDRKQISGFAEGGYAKELTSLLPEGMTGYSETFPDAVVTANDVKAAVGERFITFTLAVPESFKVIGEYIKTTLEPFQIFVDLKVLPEGTFTQSLERGDNQAYILGWQYVLPTPEVFFRSIFSENIGQKGSLNGISYKDDVIKNKLMNIEKEGDETKRAGLLQDLQTYLTKKAIVFPLIDLRIPYLMYKRINFTPRIDGEILFNTISFNSL